MLRLIKLSLIINILIKNIISYNGYNTKVLAYFISISPILY